ncbi:porin family protein [Roseivirga misakiensis]|nr:PorT family protein [Roseivirga misakiensis]
MIRIYNISPRLIFLALFLIIGVELSAQVEFKPGYILDGNGNRVTGFVGDAFWKVTPDRIQFKKSEGQVVENYSAEDIRGFGFEDMLFVSARVSMNKLFSEDDVFSETPKIEYVEQTVFLQYLVDGPKTLVQNIDSTGYTRFFIQNGADYKLLLYQEYLQKNASGKTERLTIKVYQGELLTYFADCNDFRDQIKKTNYKQKSLKILFKKYFECSGVDSDEVTFTNGNKVKPEYSVLGGITSTQVKYKEESRANDAIQEFPSELGFAVGLGVEYYTSRRKHLSVHVDLTFSRFEAELEEEVQIAGSTGLAISSIGYNSIRLQLQLRRHFDLGPGQLFLGAGGSFGTLGLFENTRTVQRQFGGSTIESSADLLSDPVDYYTGVIVGLGYDTKRFTYELRNEFGSNLGASLNFEKTITSRLHFLVSFKL